MVAQALCRWINPLCLMVGGYLDWAGSLQGFITLNGFIPMLSQMGFVKFLGQPGFFLKALSG
jgi:hypothetical protein